MSGIPSEPAEAAAIEPPGIYSKVDAVCRVCPETAHLSLSLSVMARNQGNSPLALREPYYLPPIRGVSNLSAHDAHGPLQTVRSHGRDGVRFRPGAVIEPDGEYRWFVSFECPGAFERQGKNIAGPFPITVQHRFNGVEVSVHEFYYEFVFPKPKPKTAWPFRTVYVTPIADRDVKASTKPGWQETRCKLQFSLPHKEVLRLFFASRYEFSSVFTLGLAAVLTVVGSEFGPRFAAWLVTVVRAWLT